MGLPHGFITWVLSNSNWNVANHGASKHTFYTWDPAVKGVKVKQSPAMQKNKETMVVRYCNAVPSFHYPNLGVPAMFIKALLGWNDPGKIWQFHQLPLRVAVSPLSHVSRIKLLVVSDFRPGRMFCSIVLAVEQCSKSLYYSIILVGV